MTLLLDSSGAIALLDRGDRAHQACVAAASVEDELVVPALTLVEIDYWCRKAGANAAFARFVADMRIGAYHFVAFQLEDATRTVGLMETYSTLDLGIVDASVIAQAERLGITRVLTLDRRDFSVVRPRHCAALTLEPATP